MRSTAASLALLALAGCASLDSPYRALPAATELARTDATGECLRRLQSFDAAIDAAALRDVQAIRVPGYPYLRADRLAVRASEQAFALDARPRVERMAALDAEARAFEMTNLGLAPAERAKVAHCQQELAASALEHAQQAASAAVVPDDYSDTLRIIGLYPLAQIPFSAGVTDWQDSVLKVFRTPWSEVPVEGERLRYVLAAGAESPGVAGLLPAADPPAPDAARAWRLLQLHAPAIVVDTLSGDDRIGALAWDPASGPERVSVDVRSPVLYARIAWTEIAGSTRLQLVYTLWFPARTARSTFDLEAGPLDGLIWRVTLDDRDRPLIYDSIHPCGCFHMFFPTAGVRARSEVAGQGAYDERLLAPQSLPTPGPTERVAVYVSARTHQIQRVELEARDSSVGRGYRLLDENLLRALPLAPGGATSRSAYGPDAMIAGTERAERWLYWPMGIPSAGQMRQWGHHATAFVGRRHFDDPGLIDRYFTLVPRITDGQALSPR